MHDFESAKTESLSMSTLSPFDKRKLEKLFGMESGYVLDFTDRTFHEFVSDIVGKNIYEPAYRINSGSKANCLRGFWNHEPDHVVAPLLTALIEYAAEESPDPQLANDCRVIVERLRQAAPVEDFGSLHPLTDDRVFASLHKALKDSIAKNEPELALDRLHTFLTKYMREVCVRHGISTDKGKPLHSLIGEYVKAVKAKGMIASPMTERILKSAISLLEAFNQVRNEQSLAHDNPLVSEPEATLIFNSIASTIRFINAVERDADAKVKADAESVQSDDLPF